MTFRATVVPSSAPAPPGVQVGARWEVTEMKVMSMVAAAVAAALALGMVASIPGAASASTKTAAAGTQFGTISNFDVFNDTGQVTEGFEIELDGIASTDITYTFG